MASPTSPTPTARQVPWTPSPTATPPFVGLDVAAPVPDEAADEVAADVAVDGPGVLFPAVTVTGCNVIESVAYTLSPCSIKGPVMPAATKLEAVIPTMQVAGLVVPAY